MRSLAIRMLGAWLAAILHTWHASLRIDPDALDDLDALLAAEKAVILAFWHGKYVPLFPLIRGRKGVALVADSFRGRVVGDIARRFGYAQIHIPPNKRGASGQAVIEAVRAGHLGGFAVDGPRGPYHQVRAGAIETAMHLQAAIVPISLSARPALVLRKRWDRMMLPLPFARLSIVVGEPIRPPSGLSRDEFGPWQDAVRQALEALDFEAENRLG